MVELLIVGVIILLGWALSNLLIARLPVPAARNQFGLIDVLAAMLCYGAFISLLSAVVGPHFKSHFTFYIVSTLILHAAGFLIVLDFLEALAPRAGVWRRIATIFLFQCAFVFTFLIIIPAWGRWRIG